MSERAPFEFLDLFVGPDGLRAVWSLLIFALLAFAFSNGLDIAVSRFYDPVVRHDHALTVGEVLASDGVDVAGLLAAALVVSRLERRPFRAYGLGGERRFRNLVEGLVVGLAALSLLVGGLRAGHLLAFDAVELHGGIAIVQGAKWALAFLVVGLFEEFYFRGFAQYTLARGVAVLVRRSGPAGRHAGAIGFAVAAFLLSFVYFAYTHSSNRGESAVGLVAVAVAGLTFAYSLWRTGSLWWAIGFHAAWDWAQSYVYGVPDSGGMIEGHLLASHPVGAAVLSGGSTGPEGSVFVIPTLVLAGLVVHVTHRKRTGPEDLHSG